MSSVRVAKNTRKPMYRVVVQDLAQYVFGQGKTLCRVAFYDHSFSGCEEAQSRA